MVAVADTCVVAVADTCVVAVADTCVVAVADTCVVAVADTCVVAVADTCVVAVSETGDECFVGLKRECCSKRAKPRLPGEFLLERRRQLSRTRVAFHG